MKVCISFSFPVGYEICWYIHGDILFTLRGLESTLIKSRGLDVLFRKRSFCGDQGADTSGEGSFLFVKMVWTHNRELGFINLSRFRDIRVFNKIFYF